MFEFMSRKRTFGIIITAIAGCLLPLSLAAEVFKIGGTGGDLGTMGQLARAYEKANPDVTIQVLSSLGSGGGVKAVLAGAVDLGLSARPMNKKEVAAGAVVNAYAKTPLVFTVPARHPQKNISTDDVVRIYAGQRKKFDDGSFIRLVLRSLDESDTQHLIRAIPGMKAADTEARKRHDVPVTYNDQETADFLERTPGAFGPISMSVVRGEGRRLNILSLDGVVPNSAALADSRYPLFKTFYFVTSPAPSDRAKAFMAFARAPAGRKIMEQTGHQILGGTK